MTDNLRMGMHRDGSEAWIINQNGLAAVVAWATKLSTPVEIEPLPFDNWRVVWVHGKELGSNLPFEIEREFPPNLEWDENLAVPGQHDHSHECPTHGPWFHDEVNCDPDLRWLECPRPYEDHSRVGEA